MTEETRAPRVNVDVIPGHRYPYQTYLLKKKLEASGLKTDAKKLDFYIAGGALRSVFSREPIADLDIYFPSSEAYRYFKATVMKQEVRKPGQKEGEGKMEALTPKFQTANAESYRVNGVSIQLIKFYYGRPGEIFAKFDFTICMALYCWASGNFYMHERFLEHLARRDIVFYPQTEYPISSLWRLKKFLLRGYRVRAIEFIKVALSVHNLKLDTYADLRHQLEGIDTLFLGDVISALGYKDDETYEINEAIQFISDTLEQKLQLQEQQDEEE